jgi:O-antigen/teichoic acid export membrane protein
VSSSLEPPLDEHERAADRRPSFRRSVSATFGTALFGAALGLGNVLVVGRALGPVGRGEIAFLTTIATFSHYLFTFGVHEANANVGGAEPDERRPLASNSLVLSVLLGGLAIGLVATVIRIFPRVGGGEPAALRWSALATIPVLLAGTYFTRLIQAQYRFTAANIAAIVPSLTQFAVNIALALAHELTVARALAAWIGGQAIATGFLIFTVARRLEGFGRPTLPLARRTLSFGIRAHAGDVMLLGNYRLDQWFLGASAGTRELGLYSVAVAWAEGLFLVPSAVGAVQRPDLVRANRADAARQAARTFRLGAVVTAALVVVAVVAAPVLCVTLFGPKFSDSVPMLRILAPGALGVLALKVLGNALIAQRSPMLQTLAIGIGFASSIALDLALIPHWAGIGASVAATLSYVIGGGAAVVIFVRTLRAVPRDLAPRSSDLAMLRGQLGRRR